MNILEKIKEERKIQLEKEILHFKTPSLKESLLKDGLRIIAEFKKASPTAGIIQEEMDLHKIATRYLESGVGGFSVLTEEAHFLGKNEYLIEIVNSFNQVPVLRKDFIFTPFMVAHSKFMGSSAILLIVDMLKFDELEYLHNLALSLNLDVLVEVHNLDELKMALKLTNLSILGINNRNLHTFETKLETSYELMKKIPKLRDFPLVSESGIKNIKQGNELHNLGFDAILVGESIIKGHFYD